MTMPNERKDKFSVDQPPEWFDLNKYESLKTANMHQWAYNLQARSLVLEYLNITTKSELLSDDIIKLIEKSRINGFIKEEIIANYKGNITPLSTLDVDILFLAKQECESKTGNVDDLDGYKAKFQSFRHLKINFNAPLQSIKDEFNDWINYEKHLFDESFVKRKGKAIKEKKDYFKTQISDAKISQWIRHQVLPYLDLLIWMKHEKKTVNNIVLGEWLFENDINGTNLAEKTRSSTKRIAEMISSPEFVEFFINQLSPNSQGEKFEMEDLFFNTINNWLEEEERLINIEKTGYPIE